MSILPPDVASAIEEGICSGDGGEVLVKSGAHVGRIYVYQRRIAWVNCTTMTTRLTDLLRLEAEIPQATLAEVLEECQRSRSPFAETLVSWGLVEKTRLRALLGRHNARSLAAVAALPPPRMAMFVPQARAYASDFLYTLEELDAAGPGEDTTNPEIMCLESWRASIPSCELLVYLAFPDKLLGITSNELPPANLHALAGTLSSLFWSSPAARVAAAFERPADPSAPPPPPMLDQIVAMHEDGVVVFARSCDRERLLVAVCSDTTNPGRAIGMTRNVLAALEGVKPESAP